MKLEWIPALERPDLLAPPVERALRELDGLDGEAKVAEIDPELADTAAFCERYGVALEESANCVIVAARRGGETRHAAVLVQASTRADVNGAVRRHLGARKASFAPREEAVGLTGMEYGGITPIGLPTAWPILIDARVTATPYVVVGSGVRHGKIVIPGRALELLPGAEVVDGLARPAA